MTVPRIWDLPFEMRAYLSKHATRQRIVSADGHLLIVLHRVPSTRTTKRTCVYLWRNRKAEWQFSERGAGLQGLESLLDEYEEILNRLEANYDSASRAEHWYQIVEKVVPIQRAARNLFDTLREARAELGAEEDAASLQPAIDRAGNIVRNSELLQQDAKNAIDFTIAREAQSQAELIREQARAAHRLNMLAALFLPLGTIAAVFGMNLHSGLEHVSSWIFWVVLVGGVGLGLGISAYVLNFKTDHIGLEEQS